MALTPLRTSVDTTPDVSTALVPDTLDLAALWTAGFPAADLVKSAAALLTALPAPSTAGLDGRRYLTAEGPRARLVVAPGALQVARTDPARAERTRERLRSSQRIAATLGAADHLLEHRQQDADDVVRAAGVVGDWSAAEEAGAWADHLAGRIRRRDSDRDPIRSRSITSWSHKSRANMVRTLAQLDYAPLFEGGTLPAMVTLTYPGGWQAVAPSAAVCKGHVDTLKKRFQRAYGRPLVGVWKREFQRRGAPHYHILTVPPGPTMIAGRRQTFQEWLAAAWVDVVAPADPLDRAAMLAVHRGPGVVDFGEGMRARDPKRLAVYFSKHGSFGAKEYQNEAPAEWTGDVAPFADQGTVGRFWGVWGLDKARTTVEVSPVEATAAVRTLRRWQRANGFRVQRVVWRTDTRTGVQRRRKSGVWVGARIRSGSAGFAVVNDGPAMLSQLAPYLDAVREAAQAEEVDAWLSDPARLRAVDGYVWPAETVERFPVLVWSDGVTREAPDPVLW